jgi:uncharacterized protein with von Willebrand factor type A (vWA) domain
VPAWSVRYSAWDGRQVVEPLPPERLLTALADELLSGNIEQAFDRALHRGFTDDEGRQTPGLDALRDQVRAARRATEDALREDTTLRELAEALAGAAGGAEALDPQQSRLLEALAARPDAAARLLGQADQATRERLAEALQHCGPAAPVGDGEGDLTAGAPFGGSLAELLQRLQRLDDVEAQVRRVRRVADVAEIDLDHVRELLGDAAAEAVERLATSLTALAESGYVRGPGQRLELSARALQHIGDELLAQALARLSVRGAGDRVLPRSGHHDLTGTTRGYRFGDPLTLDLSRTVLQAVQRGGGVPVRMRIDDFAIFEREDSARAATVLALDLSRSMGERGYLLAAKRLALALATLIRTRFPRDRLLLTGFSESARTLTPQELPQVTWDRFGFGTNVQDALRLGRALLAAHRGLQRNLILLTDGEPTAHRDRDGQIHFSHPPSEATLAETLAEGDRLRRDGIDLCVCVLSSDLQVVRFAEQLARVGAGDLVVTAPDDLSSAVVAHYGSRRHVRR